MTIQGIRWCGRGDLNPHAFRRHPLKMVCLPVPPLPQGKSLFFGLKVPMSSPSSDPDESTERRSAQSMESPVPGRGQSLQRAYSGPEVRQDSPP